MEISVVGFEGTDNQVFHNTNQYPYRHLRGHAQTASVLFPYWRKYICSKRKEKTTHTHVLCFQVYNTRKLRLYSLIYYHSPSLTIN